ncbi:ankyrin repeat domain-containing protein [Pseudanabaena sp. UWO310]|uniref:ankyrin repeat domain-containing protein n=1 Tax=Pseudanabaena sp. UWO310 TaxID=2480795 RepID=UPI00115A7369|nr:ankyrin repeat domain-containing protein [Pseudanabaena sp. UWO310]TYQ29887.1 ankyrin repeat domain-containing protein [Pseudanabaena sp. UWO310]
MIEKPEKTTRLALQDAVSENNIDIVCSLISKKLVSLKDLSYALSIAASYGQEKMVRILIDSGADVNNYYGGGTTLTEAVTEGHIEIARMLIEAGADMSLPEYGEVSHPLAEAASKGDMDMVKLLVEAGANVNQISRSSGEYALDAAAGSGHIEVFNYLAPLTSPELRIEAERILPLGIHERELEENVDPLVRELSDFVHNEDLNGIRETLEKGVNVNGFDEVGNTALNIAVCKNNLEIVSMLLRAGADPNQANDVGYLPLDYFRRDDITALLIAAGAKNED